MPYEEATELVDHPVTCLDCHSPETMALRITRPAFLIGIQRLAESNDKLPHFPSIERWRKGNRQEPYDPNTLASRQEMRSLVCGQCHVEYYFRGPTTQLTYPWHNGLKMEQAEAYYDSIGFTDWTHATSGAPMLKAQHPEFEMWSQGIHARSGVMCADCHMPHVRVGAVKVSSHHVRSPLLHISNSCQTCHRVPEQELLDRAETIQDRTYALISRAEEATHDLIMAIKQAMESGVSDEHLTKPRELHRKAQWRLDYVFSENSMGFHADQETARILGEAIDYARQGEVAVLRHVDAAAGN
jgi:nitrite reductase (cytochrome c-552)